jgi:hypothetical protein
MTKTVLLAVLCALGVAFATTAFARTPGTKVAAAPDVRQIAPVTDTCWRGFGGYVCRQDLFDRNNPNNIRHDYHGPPAQPGQL